MLFRRLKSSLSHQLLAYWLTISLIPLVCSSLVFYHFAKESLIERSFEQLTSIRETKKKQLADFFEFQTNLVQVLSQSPAILQAFTQYDTTYDRGVDTELYAQVNAKHHPYLAKIKETYGLYDLFLVNLDGDIIYTVVHEPDFATNLIDGPYSDQNIAEAFQKGKNGATIVDFDHYAPSQGQAASFVASPIKTGSKLQGVLIAQIPLNKIDAITQERSGMGESGEVYIVGKDYLMRSDSRFSEKSTVLELRVETVGTRQALSGQTGTKIIDDYRGVPVLSSFTPMNIGSLQYAFMAEIDEEEILAPVHELMLIILGIVGSCIVLVYTLAVYFSRSFTKPIEEMKNTIILLARGILPESSERLQRQDELGDMSEAIATMGEGYKKTARFAEELGNNNLEEAYEPLSEDDILGNALLRMRGQLKVGKKENQQRAWTAEGLTRFVELIRHAQDTEDLGRQLLSQLVRYLDANQAALFIKNEDEDGISLEMIACYAYGRDKYLKKSLQPGEGMAGQAFLEKEKIVLSEVPDSYINISSGLGEERPKFVLIIPLLINEEVEGVLEIASFKELPEYAVQFVEKLAENLAATLKRIKVNEHTRKLLDESRQQTEMLQSQEEEMRQNMEELAATQEEMQRKEKSYLERIKSLEEQLNLEAENSK